MTLECKDLEEVRKRAILSQQVAETPRQSLIWNVQETTEILLGLEENEESERGSWKGERTDYVGPPRLLLRTLPLLQVR